MEWNLTARTPMGGLGRTGRYVTTTTKRLADMMEKLSPEERAKPIVEDLFRDKPTLSDLPPMFVPPVMLVLQGR